MTITVGWLAQTSPPQRRTLAAAALGWMLDSMDVMLYAMVLPTVAHEMHLSAARSGAMMSVTLISAALGGLLFGWVADRAGRTRALTTSMLFYSVATALCGLTHTPLQLLLCRLLLGFGMGGEWAAGAALVAESFSDEHRGRALALVQSFWAIGYALGAMITALVLPRFGWRAVFFTGVIPALLTLWIRRSVHESTAWQTLRAKRVSLAPLMRPPLRRATLVCATMNAATLFAWWGLFTWMPRFLSLPVAQGGHGLNVVNTSAWTIVMQIGTFAGYISFGVVAARFGQKHSYIGYLVLAAAVVPIFASIHSTWVLLVVGPWVGFFGTGYFSGFSVISSELFPTALRGTAMGFVYNIGRLASAAAPYAIGVISDRVGFGAAFSITSAAFLLAGVIATRLPPSLRFIQVTRSDPERQPA